MLRETSYVLLCCYPGNASKHPISSKGPVGIIVTGSKFICSATSNTINLTGVIVLPRHRCLITLPALPLWLSRRFSLTYDGSLVLSWTYSYIFLIQSSILSPNRSWSPAPFLSIPNSPKELCNPEKLPILHKNYRLSICQILNYVFSA